MIRIRKMEDLTPDDYRSIGLRSGLEIHQQLDTEKKLFCRCPVKQYSEDFHAQILRHMRPTLSELGEYDGTALMEFKTKKEIIYQIHKDTVCTYEIDDTPPFELNSQALDIALEITMLLNCKLVSELHIARKQYLDGSIPAGFQRTTILGVDGWIPYRNRRIGIIQLGLEEDSCREVSDLGHRRVYKTDRLGIPLVEPVTRPDMFTPSEVAEVAQQIRWLTRSSGKVRRGIGAARQDVNVSVEGGCRVEIKGVSRIPSIPLLVHNEAFRQVSLLEIKNELKRRDITESSFKSTSSDITGILGETQYHHAADAIRKGLEIRAVVLKGYRGILSTVTQPGHTFAGEISGRVRVIACIDSLPNIAYSDMQDDNFSCAEWERIMKSADASENDEVVIIWGGAQDLDTAANEIAIRAREALNGVCSETRQSLPDGTNRFERILPGPNRMYPDTDLPPIAITDEHMKRIRSSLPERPWDRKARYLKAGVPEESAHRMSISTLGSLFDRATIETPYSSRSLAHFFLSTLSHLKKYIPNLEDGFLISTLTKTGKRKLPLEAASYVLENTCGPDRKEAVPAVGEITMVDIKTLQNSVRIFLPMLDESGIEKDVFKRFIIGEIRKKFGDLIVGKDLSELIDRMLKGKKR